MAVANVLVVDDDVNLLNVVAFVLRQEGFEVSTARDGDEAIRKAQQIRPHAVVLDLMLPKRDGFEVCRILRRTSTLPILILTARTAEVDLMHGFDLGADDYLTKPFSTRELVARVKALVRRSGLASRPETGILRLGDLMIDFARRTVKVEEREVRVTPTEFKLLQTLASSPGAVFSCQSLVQQIHNYQCSEQEAAELMKVTVRRLRQKLEPDPDQPRYIVNVRGFGYALAEPSGLAETSEAEGSSVRVG